jgi:ubiquitin C-terminal hydrolase
VSVASRALCYTPADVEAANEAWDKYKQKNSSVVVDTFQGQFKSTVSIAPACSGPPMNAYCSLALTEKVFI